MHSINQYTYVIRPQCESLWCAHVCKKMCFCYTTYTWVQDDLYHMGKNVHCFGLFHMIKTIFPVFKILAPPPPPHKHSILFQRIFAFSVGLVDLGWAATYPWTLKIPSRAVVLTYTDNKVSNAIKSVQYDHNLLPSQCII